MFTYKVNTPRHNQKRGNLKASLVLNLHGGKHGPKTQNINLKTGTTDSQGHALNLYLSNNVKDIVVFFNIKIH